MEKYNLKYDTNRTNNSKEAGTSSRILFNSNNSVPSMKMDITNVRAYAVLPTPLSAALTAAVKSRWKNGVSVDTSEAYPIGGESVSESDFLTSPDSRSPSTSNRGNADGSLEYGTTAAISC